MSSLRALVDVEAIAAYAIKLEELIAGGTYTPIRTWKISAHLLAATVIYQTLIHVLATLAIGTQSESLATGANSFSGSQADLFASVVVHLAEILGQTGVLLDQVESFGTLALITTGCILASVTAKVCILCALINVLATECLTAVARWANATEAGIILTG